ncbi:MAG: RluA family pseudouridine synthase [Candidatus Magasanikbacteria bacterium]|nr:RluA family pseudouridine synthase [Candidatus Magasanikbacteria bacterium]
MKKIIIAEEEVGKRLDLLLTEKLPSETRNKLQKLVKQGSITLNGKTVTPHLKTKLGDIIEINSLELKITNPKTITEDKNLPKIKIIEENPEYLIFNKPAGLTVHGTKFVKGKTLVDVLLKDYPELKKIGEDPDRPGIVHRLDSDVSGLMVIPRTQDSFDNLKKQFQKRTVKKRYTGLCYGTIIKKEDEINFPIARSLEGYRMAALPMTVKGLPNPNGKKAITFFHITKRFLNYTLLEIKIKTGRTHQIRVHMAAYGNPLVGDDLYGTRRHRERNEKLKLGRVFLASCELEFTNLAGERKNYKIDLPKQLEEILNRIK